MVPQETIVCRPTRWFIFRAVVALLVFGIFSVLFYQDGSVGYRRKNQEFYLHQAFNIATTQYAEKTKDADFTAAQWKEYAAAQKVPYPSDPYILPAGTPLPSSWPEYLQDAKNMESRQLNLIWKKYSAENGYNEKPAEEPYPKGKINEQWWALSVCATLFAIFSFFLVRTLMRKISADETMVHSQDGKHVLYSELKRIDLRKWQNKGLAFAEYEKQLGAGKKGRLRIDGMTYGGFNKDHGEPAEKLMQKILANFSGELIEYTAPVDPVTDATAG